MAALSVLGLSLFVFLNYNAQVSELNTSQAAALQEYQPDEAGVGFAVKLGKGEFHGRDVLARQKAAGVRRKLSCLTLSDPAWVALGGEPVRADGRVVGRVTSGGGAPRGGGGRDR